MADRKKSATQRLRDLDNPTAAFPIGALNRGTPPTRHALEEDETERRPMSRAGRIPIRLGFSDDDEDYDDSRAFPLPPEPVSVDPRLLVVGLLVATGIAMLGAVIAAVMVMM
jgi:hypothetical protein